MVLVVGVVEVVADPLLVLNALVDDAVAEEEEVGGEGEGPGARDGFLRSGVSGCGWDLRRGFAGLTKHFGDGDAESDGGTHVEGSW